MKTVKFFAILAILIALYAATSPCQAQRAAVKNVISTHRVFPKIDRVLEFEKAIANHAQKYHNGDSH